MAHDFRNKTFQKVLRGYAPEEVEDYISYLNEEYRKLERRTADSERKLALALKKLEESAKNGAGDASVGPAAREAAAKLLREADAKRSDMLAMAEQQANETAERIVRDAETQAEAVIAEAVGQAEAILAEAKVQAEAVLADAQVQAELHKNDVKTIYAAARGMYEEIGAFREKLFGLYDEHLDSIENITDSAAQFMDGIDGQYPEGAEEGTDAELPEPEEQPETVEEVAEEPASDEDSAEELPPETVEEAEEADPEPEEPEISDDVASNLAFMDRLFAAMKQADMEETPVADDVPAAESDHPEDLYIDLPDDYEDGESDDFEDFEEEPAEPETDGEFYEDEIPAIMIDWKNRSAAQVDGAEESDLPDENTDFRPAEGFEDFEEDYEDYAEEYDDGTYGENYDDYVPADDALTEELPADDDSEESDEDEEEDEGLRAMDALFREDKSKRDMSLTDEFNIIFDDSKSHANVKEIRRQPTVSPEAPKNPKKHKNF